MAGMLLYFQQIQARGMESLCISAEHLSIPALILSRLTDRLRLHTVQTRPTEHDFPVDLLLFILRR